MRLFQPLLAIAVATPTVLALVTPHWRILTSIRANVLLQRLAATASDVDFEAPITDDDLQLSSTSNVVPQKKKTHREMQIEQLEQDIQAALEHREELRLQLEQEIRDFQKVYEDERSNLENVDAGINKQIQRLERVKTGGGGGLQEMFSSFKSTTPLLALSGAAVVATRVVLQRRQQQKRLEEELEQERLEQEREIRRLMEVEAQTKLVQSRRSAFAVRTIVTPLCCLGEWIIFSHLLFFRTKSIAATGVIGTGLFVSTFFTDRTIPTDVVESQESSFVAEKPEAKPTLPEADFAPTAHVDSPPTSPGDDAIQSGKSAQEEVESNGTLRGIANLQVPDTSEVTGVVSKALEKNLDLSGASDFTSAVSKSLKSLQLPHTLKLGDTMSKILEDLPRNAPALAAAGATLTAAMVATVLSLSKDSESTSSTSIQPLKSEPDATSSFKKLGESALPEKQMMAVPEPGVPTSVAKPELTKSNTSVSDDSKPPTKLERRGVESKAAMSKAINLSLPERDRTESVASKSQPSASTILDPQSAASMSSFSARPAMETTESSPPASPELFKQPEREEVTLEASTSKPSASDGALDQQQTTPTTSKPFSSHVDVSKPTTLKPTAQESAEKLVVEKTDKSVPNVIKPVVPSEQKEVTPEASTTDSVALGATDKQMRKPTTPVPSTSYLDISSTNPKPEATEFVTKPTKMKSDSSTPDVTKPVVQSAQNEVAPKGDAASGITDRHQTMPTTSKPSQPDMPKTTSPKFVTPESNIESVSSAPPPEPVEKPERQEMKSGTATTKPAIPSSLDMQQTKNDVTKSAKTKVAEVPETPKPDMKTETQSTPSPSPAARSKDFFKQGSVPKDPESFANQQALKENELVQVIDKADPVITAKEWKTVESPKAKVAAPNKPGAATRSPARGFGKPAPVKSKSKSSKPSNS